MRSAPLLALTLLCACDRGPNLDGLGEALLVATLVLAAVAALVAYLGVLAARGLWSALRQTRQADAGPAPAVRAWWLSLFVIVVHAGLVLATSEFTFADNPLAQRLLAGSVVPVALTLYIAVLAARRRVRWPLLASVPLLVAWSLLLVEVWQRRGLTELPGRVQQLASASHNACARLSTGQIACVGANWGGQRGDGNQRDIEAPTLVRGIDDARTVVVAYRLTCAVRTEHGATCWGGADTELPIPGDPRLPWSLPDGGDVVALVSGDQQIVTLSADGALRGWPAPLPGDRQRARLLAGDDDFDGAWACAVEPDDALACWSLRHTDQVHRFTPPPVTELAIDADIRVACAADVDGAARCYSLETGKQNHTIALPGLRQLVAADDDGSFCALADGRVTCWRFSGWPHEAASQAAFELTELAGVERIVGGGGHVCGERAGVTRCLAPAGRPEPQAARLLAHDLAD